MSTLVDETKRLTFTPARQVLIPCTENSHKKKSKRKKHDGLTGR